MSSEKACKRRGNQEKGIDRESAKQREEPLRLTRGAPHGFLELI